MLKLKKKKCTDTQFSVYTYSLLGLNLRLAHHKGSSALWLEQTQNLGVSFVNATYAYSALDLALLSCVLLRAVANQVPLHGKTPYCLLSFNIIIHVRMKFKNS